jgi:hypothetical protein
LGHCPEDLAHDFVMPSITKKNNGMFEFKNFLEYDHSWNEVSFYMNFETPKHPISSPVFCGDVVASSHALNHFCYPLPLFLVQMTVFYKTNFIFLIEIEVKLTHTLESSMAYWQHLDIAWPPNKSLQKV